ncbi:MAG: methylated-DNA--[protein]-cysteine S-methyltransferase [Candidatus Cybelea sp.]|jgi:AraC family transcriptional regulator, regulatory protein of adaptative response / methylated-DNA-[protein]-cysteine methyltransferase
MNEVERIHETCRYVEEHSDETLSLEMLAKKAKMSKYHFARRFKEVVGVTPKQYAAEMRLRRLKGALKEKRSVDDALYGAGYGSPSRVYEKAVRSLGMTPAQYRSAGQGISISYATVETPVGLMMIGATDRGICFAQFGDSTAELLGRLGAEYANATIVPAQEPYHSDFPKWVDAISRYLAGAQPHLDLPLDIRASAFQMRVWKYLQSIPYGDVASYGEVAAAIGRPSAARAVGGAIARNTVALIIPCHRVIRESGALGGYRWGFERKRALLDLERSHRGDRKERPRVTPKIQG